MPMLEALIFRIVFQVLHEVCLILVVGFEFLIWKGHHETAVLAVFT